jgi:cytochrome c553
MQQLALAALAVAATGAVHAQQAAPRFAPSNLTPAGVRALAATCASCHGPEGRPAAGSTSARLAGRPAEASLDALEAFRDGRKPGTVMPQIARGYEPAELRALAAYFARVAP